MHPSVPARQGLAQGPRCAPAHLPSWGEERRGGLSGGGQSYDKGAQGAMGVQEGTTSAARQPRGQLGSRLAELRGQGRRGGQDGAIPDGLVTAGSGMWWSGAVAADLGVAQAGWGTRGGADGTSFQGQGPIQTRAASRKTSSQGAASPGIYTSASPEYHLCAK